MAKQRQRKATIAFATALAEGKSVRAAGEVAGVSQRTAYRWAEDVEVQTEARRIRQAMIDAAAGLLAKLATAATATLGKLLKAKSETVRLGAARSILELGLKHHEAGELAARIEELEALAQEVEA